MIRLTILVLSRFGRLCQLIVLIPIDLAFLSLRVVKRLIWSRDRQQR